MADFTIPKSYCTLYYKDLQDKVLIKKYYNALGTKYFINGDVGVKKYEFFNNIFPTCAQA